MMKIFAYTSAIIMALSASSVFAHHPSEGMNPNFDRVEAQLEAVDSPHLDMTFDDMGATTAAGDSDMSTAIRDQAGWQANQVQPGDAFDPDSLMDGPGAIDTIDLLENVAE